MRRLVSAHLLQLEDGRALTGAFGQEARTERVAGEVSRVIAGGIRIALDEPGDGTIGHGVLGERVEPSERRNSRPSVCPAAAVHSSSSALGRIREPSGIATTAPARC